MFVRITKAAARKRFAEELNFVLCPCKCYPHNGGFVTHITILSGDIRQYKDHAAWYAPKTDDPNNILWKGSIEATAWNLMYNDWSFYNCSYEQGYYAHYYLETGVQP